MLSPMNRKDMRRLKLAHFHVSPDARTVPINLRMPIGLLATIKREAGRDMPYQRLIKRALADRFLWKPRPVKCGGLGCSPYGNKDWTGPKPQGG